LNNLQCILLFYSGLFAILFSDVYGAGYMLPLNTPT
jgi:hypothetical protein